VGGVDVERGRGLGGFEGRLHALGNGNQLTGQKHY